MSDANLQIISDPSDLRKYRTELPNLYDDSALDVYEFRLLAHYKRVGKCTEGLETTAKKCRMSEGKVSEARQSLSDKEFVRLEKVPMDKGRYRYNVQVVDRWIENFARYSDMSEQEIADQLKKASPSPREGIPSLHEASPSPREGKKEPLKNPVLVVVNADIKKISDLYEAEFGMLTAWISDAIKDAVDTYPPDWIPEAMQIAVESNVRTWKYVESVLKNCVAKKIRPSLNKLEARNGYSKSGNKQGARPKQSTSIPATVEQDAAKLTEINRRRKLKRERQSANV